MTDELPLKSQTPARWAQAVLTQPLALLGDHVYLERKAAANALELLNRWPEPAGPADWVNTLASVARDETSHLHTVARLLARRGGALPRSHRNPYASALHEQVRRGQGKLELLDRLLVSALIEVRSCERFGVLGEVSRDAGLTRLYRGLWSSEFGHYQVFLRLARAVVGEAVCEKNWEHWLRIESEVLARQTPGPRMHSGVGD